MKKIEEILITHPRGPSRQHLGLLASWGVLRLAVAGWLRGPVLDIAGKNDHRKGTNQSAKALNSHSTRSTSIVSSLGVAGQPLAFSSRARGWSSPSRKFDGFAVMLFTWSVGFFLMAFLWW